MMKNFFRIVAIFLAVFLITPSCRPSLKKGHKLVRGTNVDYVLKLPSDSSWMLKREVNQYDITISLGTRLSIGVIANPRDEITTQQLSAEVRSALAANNGASFSDSRQVEIDRRTWERFVYSGQVEGKEVKVICQTYSGQEGIFVLCGSSYEGEWKRNESELLQVMNGFEFEGLGIPK